MSIWNRAAAILAIGLGGIIAFGTPGRAEAGGGVDDRVPYEAHVFSTVPDPGFPEGIAIDRKRGLIWIGTNPNFVTTGGRPPSKLFAFRWDGRLERSFEIEGQDRGAPSYGLYGLALDRAGSIYAADQSPGRIVSVDPNTGAQRLYATIPDLAPCATGTSPCSPTSVDNPPWPNVPIFVKGGDMYVTDTAQATIWRIPRGGEPEVWLSDESFDSTLIGLNGLAVARDNSHLLAAVSKFPQAPGDASGFISRIELKDDGSAGELTRLWTSDPYDVPDGLAVNRDGSIFAALAGSNALALISPEGTTLERIPSTAERRFDSPANIALSAGSALVTNLALFTRSDFRILDVRVDRKGKRLARPRL